MQKLILIKLGGSLITDKDKAFIAREKAIRRLAREIKKGSGQERIIVGHGSGSFGHQIASKYRTNEGIMNKNSLKGLALTSDAAVKLNRIVLNVFLKESINAMSFAPSSFILSKHYEEENFYLDPLKQALNVGILPIVYGDVILDKSEGFGIFSTERVLNIIANGLKKDYQIDKIIYCGDTNGVYDEDGKTVKVITPEVFKKLKKAIGGAGTKDVTGGMLHKVSEALLAAKKLKCEILIINGKVKGNLKKALSGRKTIGTLIKN